MTLIGLVRNTHIVKGLITCHRTQKDSEKNAPGLAALFGIKKFHYIIVTYDDSFMVNSPIYRDIVDKELQSEIGDLIPKYHIASISDFEYLVAYAGQEGFSKLLAEKEVEPKLYEYDFREFMIHMREKLGQSADPVENKFLKTETEIFFESITGKPF